MDCIVHGVTKSQTRLSDFHFAYKIKAEMEDLASCFFSVLQMRNTLIMLDYTSLYFFNSGSNMHIIHLSESRNSYLLSSY